MNRIKFHSYSSIAKAASSTTKNAAFLNRYASVPKNPEKTMKDILKRQIQPGFAHKVPGKTKLPGSPKIKQWRGGTIT